jgi:hypothetical protein
MRKALFAIVLVAALGYAAPATAGCWATAQLVKPPDGTPAGAPWTAHITILQHGRNPLPDAREARPRVGISNAAGDRKIFTATPVDPLKGTYKADIVFPSNGTWRFSVFDDFTTWNKQSAPCSRWHKLGTVQIGPAPPGTGSNEAAGSFPVWPVTGGLGAVLLILGGAVFFAVRARRTAVA